MRSEWELNSHLMTKERTNYLTNTRILENSEMSYEWRRERFFWQGGIDVEDALSESERVWWYDSVDENGKGKEDEERGMRKKKRGGWERGEAKEGNEKDVRMVEGDEGWEWMTRKEKTQGKRRRKYPCRRYGLGVPESILKEIKSSLRHIRTWKRYGHKFVTSYIHLAPSALSHWNRFRQISKEKDLGNASVEISEIWEPADSRILRDLLQMRDCVDESSFVFRFAQCPRSCCRRDVQGVMVHI